MKLTGCEQYTVCGRTMILGVIGYNEEYIIAMQYPLEIIFRGSFNDCMTVKQMMFLAIRKGVSFDNMIMGILMLVNKEVTE